MTMSGEDRTGEPLPEPIFERSAADEVAEELQFHIDMRARELVAQGLAPPVAERAARERFADLDRVTAECHQLAGQREQSVKRTRYVRNLVQDIHFALRMLRRRPAFAFLAIMTIGLGIGAATAIYSVVDGVMLRPLPFNESGKLVAIWVTEQRFHDDPTLFSWWDRIVLGQEEFEAVRQKTTTVHDVALWGRGVMTLTTDAGSERVPELRVTANLLNTLQVRPALGRAFLPGEDVLNGPHIAMISWESWQGRWHGDSSIIGRSIMADKTPYTVVGVLPRGLRMDRSAPIADIWEPALQDSSDMIVKHNRSYAALARLNAGVTVAQANADVSRAIAASATDARGPVKGKGIAARVEQWQVDQTRTVRASLWILLGAVMLLLLIACVNVATLMLGEAARREPEIAARAALGAAPSRIARQLLTESVAIALAGASVGVLLAIAGTRVLVAMAPAKIPGLDDVRIDWRVLAFTIACALATGILFGIVPTLVLLRKGRNVSVRIGTGQTARGARTLQHGLIAVEIALSLVLLVGCTLLGRSLERLTAVAPGFDAKGLVALKLTQDREFWRDDDRMQRYFTLSVRELAAIPGVTSVTASSGVPFTGNSSSSPVKSDVKEYGPEESGTNAQQRSIFANYFSVMHIPILAGRAFNDGDHQGSELVAIISEAEARRDWPSVAALGRRIFWQGKWRTIVGIVGDVKYEQLSRADEPTIYVPFAQYTNGNMTFALRYSGDVAAMERPARERLRPLDAAVSVASATGVATLIGKSYGEERYRALLASLFGILAGALAAIGVFGVVSRAAARRTRESGIRIALGAPAAALTRMLLRETMVGVVLGLAIGIPAAFTGSRLLAPYLFGVTASDPLAFGIATVALIAGALLATLPPARRAAKVDPAVVLRSE